MTNSTNFTYHGNWESEHATVAQLTILNYGSQINEAT